MVRSLVKAKVHTGTCKIKKVKKAEKKGLKCCSANKFLTRANPYKLSDPSYV